MRHQRCATLDESSIECEVLICGWAHRRRDHGGVIFIDLRDLSGLIQVVVDPDTPVPFAIAEGVRSEFVLQVRGGVRRRPAGTENATLATGAVEVLAHQIEVLNRSEPLPFQLDEGEASESVRLKYRFLDLRREFMQRNLRLRHRIASHLRRFLDQQGFIEIETPVLTRSTPEGARDYLVPSRTHPGAFFALPQSPQLFKQLLMVAGFERYYQIARCFRDEDLRADRQPEFTQLDIEMSFVDETDVIDLMEHMIRELFAAVLEVALPDPFPRMSYAEALARFGTDRPDLRVPLELTELTDLMAEVDFKVFSVPATTAGGRVAALRVPGGGRLSRQQLDGYTEFVKTYGARGLAYIKINERAAGRAGLQSPIVKFLSDAVLEAVLDRSGAVDGDLVLFGADQARIVNDALAALRLKVGRELGLIESGWRPLWVVDFPLVEWDADGRRWQALHHPFTAPQADQLATFDVEPGAALSRAYDLVLNGSEVGGGSIRIHQGAVQSRVFELLGIGADEAQAKFGFLLEALKFGAPPHGGIAFGLDRLVAIMAGVDSIRDVIAFPKTQKASCLLTEAPGQVDDAQLRELGLQRRTPAMTP